LKRELDNVARFIDGESTTVFVTSQYRFGGWTDQESLPLSANIRC
jgi:hypothetical protein